jgi:hypothetical protein
MITIGFLAAPAPTADSRRSFDEDVAELGYVMNVSRLWAYQPAALTGLFDLVRQVLSVAPLSVRQRSILVAACASAFGDSYCSLVWGGRLAEQSDAGTAARVLLGVGEVARDPNGTGPGDVQQLRDAGFADSQIFAITVFVALRLAFSTINDALGLRPDAGLRSTAPGPVREAVTFGRPIDDPA